MFQNLAGGDPNLGNQKRRGKGLRRDACDPLIPCSTVTDFVGRYAT